jgi:hypothetical protein
MLRLLLGLVAALALAACSSVPGPAASVRTLAPGSGTSKPAVTSAPGSTSKPVATLAATPSPTPVPTAIPTVKVTGWPAGAIGTEVAPQHVGQTATVCGVVVSAEWTPAAKGHPTFLNLDVPYPGARFNVVIWGEQRREWPVGAKPEVALPGKTVCVTGVIETYLGVQQIAGASKASIAVLP